MKKIKKAVLAVLSVFIFAAIASGCSAGQATNPNKVKLDPKAPETITVWHYYNGAQQEAFNDLVSEFNDTEGKELGIVVESFSQGNVTDLEATVLDAANKKVGAADIPNIFAAYADTAYAVDKLGLVEDLDPYFTQEEKDAFIQSYLEEGRFTAESGLKIFPIAKSTEILMVNKTDWDKFAEATGATVDDLKTLEGTANVAKEYYEWTDGLTPDVPNDGQALLSRDAVANYFFVGSKQLGQEIFSIQEDGPVLSFDKEIAKKLWDNYYVPMIHGYYAKSGRFGSDDVKTGEAIACVGSTSGATYFPDEVIINDTDKYPIEMMVLPAPQFEGGDNVAVQQGAGLVVTNTDEKGTYASVQFLKWLTQEDRNINFSYSSGYLPVLKEANDFDKIKQAIGSEDDEILSVLEIAIDTVNGNELYTPKAFENGTSARAVALAGGATLEEAVAEFMDEANFNGWYEDMVAQLEAQL